MREQVDSFLKAQVCEAKRQVEEAQAAQNVLQGCLRRHPTGRVKVRSSRALLREIERAALDATSVEVPKTVPSGRSVLVNFEVQAQLMREQVDSFLKQQVSEAKRQVEEAHAAHRVLQGCLQRHPRARGKVRSSRILLREIERAAIEAGSVGFPETRPTGTSVLVGLQVQTEMVREQVDAFLKQQVWEAKHQVEEAQAAHHILLGCLQRVKHEPRRMGKFKKESTFGGWARARASPPSNKASPEPKKPCIEATVGDACKRGKIEELYQENMQLKAALAASRADAAAATRKADTLQAKVDKLLQENGQLLFQATESQKESDELMLSAASKERLLMTKLKEKQQQIGHMQLERMELRRSLAQRGD